MRQTRTIIIGSRGSQLALCQTQHIVNRLQDSHPQFRFVIKRIRTRGDEPGSEPSFCFEGKGEFVRELEAALLAGEIDIAAHSFKDLPLDLPQGLEIASVSERADARDVLISMKANSLSQLRRGASIGTGSPRRAAQIKAFRPDLDVGDIRGNIDTRLRKVSSGQFDGIILAAAGLIRLGWEERITEYLSMDICLPAVAQGALAMEVREGDEEIKRLVSVLNHEPTRQATTAEQAFLRFLGGGCHTPIAAFGQISSGILELEGMVSTSDGGKLLRARVKGSAELPEEAGSLLGEKLIALGAREILGGTT
ncbi:MAG: hydroxymethylbilane synthase [Dehalococcoidia bacterium]|nr:Porphobilinogen deaminase [Chloroflexota bacterium]